MQLLEKLVGVKTKDQFELQQCQLPEELLTPKLVTGSNIVKLSERVSNLTLPFNFNSTNSILFDQVSLPTITADFLPTWIKIFVDSLAEQCQIPVGIVIIQALTILGACLQKTFVVDPYGDDDSAVPLNLWSLVSSSSASNTSAVLNALVKPVIEWEQEQAAEWAPLVESAEVAQDIYSKEIQRLRTLACKVDIQALLEKKDSKEFNDIVNELLLIKQNRITKSIILPRKVFATNINRDCLINELIENNARTAVFTDQSNIFESKISDILLAGYAGRLVKVKRGKKYIELNNITLSLGLILDPQALEELTTNRKRHSFNNSELLAKFLYYLPPSNIGKRQFKNRKTISQNTRDIYSYGIKVLLGIPLIPIIDQATGRCRPAPRRLQLSDEALELWEQFLELVESELGKGGKLAYLQDWAGELPNQVLRIAGLLHVAYMLNPVADTKPSLPIQNIDKSLVIDNKVIELAIGLAYKLIPHAQVAYNCIDNGDKNITDARYALKWIVTNAEVDQNGEYYMKPHALHLSSRFSKTGIKRVNNALQILFEQNIIRQPCTLPTRKPTNIRFLNSQVFDLITAKGIV